MVAKICIHLFSAGFTNSTATRCSILTWAPPRFWLFNCATVTGLLGFCCEIGFWLVGYRNQVIPALFGAATLYLVARFIFEMKGGITALVVASIAFLASPGFLLLFSIFTPNAFEVFFWTLAIFFIFKLLITENPKYWILIGIVLGISFLTKYSVLFLIAGFFTVSCFFQQRKLLFSWWFVVGIGVWIVNYSTQHHLAIQPQLAGVVSFRRIEIKLSLIT